MTRKKKAGAKKKSERPKPPPPIPRSRGAVIACFAATLVLVGADLWSKDWAEDALSAERFGEPPPVCVPADDGRPRLQRTPTEPVVLVEDYLQFRYAENCGAAFGIMGSGAIWSRIIFVVAACIATIALFVMFIRGRGQRLFALSVPMIVSGALGNLVDRIRYGYVVDFIKFDIPDLINYPTFNIADIGITVGVILLVLDGFREGREEKKAEKAGKKGRTKKNVETAKARKKAKG